MHFAFVKKNCLIILAKFLKNILQLLAGLQFGIYNVIKTRVGFKIRETTRFLIYFSSQFMKFLSPETALYLYKSTMRAGAPSYYLELLDKLQKRICKTVGPSLAASLEPLAHRQNVASLSLFYRHYFGGSSSELTQLVSLRFSRRRSTR